MPQDLPLLTDAFPFRLLRKPRLVESSHTPGKQVLEVTGVFQNWKLKNENGRKYGKKIWERHFAEGSDFSNRLKRRNVLGMMEHPKDGVTLAELASHVITEVHIATPAEISQSGGELEEGDVVGTYEVLPGEYFPKAKILEGCIRANIDFGGVSSRGNGTVTETSDAFEVNDDYILETWDVVFTPSVKRARPVAKAFESAPVKTTAPSLKEEAATSAASEPTPAKEEEEDMTESSFVLITGLYGPGKAEEGKKMIPIELIAESKGKNVSFRWRAVNESDKAPPLGTFQQFTEATNAMTALCNNTGFIFESATASTAETTQTTPPNTMNVQDRIRQIQSEAVLLANSKRTGLKLSEASALLERAKSLRIELAQLQEQNSFLSSIIAPVAKKLVEYEEEMDAPPPPPPAPEGDAPPAPGGDEAPPPAPGGEEGDMTADEAASIIDQAVQALHDAGNEEVASQLQSVGDQIGAAEGPPGGEEGIENNVDLDDVPPMEDSDVPKLESNAKARNKFVESYRKLRSRYVRLRESSAKLMKAYKNLNESSHNGEGSTSLKEAEERATKSEAAAREIAARYNTEMIELGEYIWKLKKPKLFEANKEALSKCPTWKAYDELSRKIISEADEQQSPPAPQGAEDKGAMTESAPKGAAPVKEEAPPPPAPPVEESVHPMVASISRARQHIPLYS